jgi:hypothetical protein
MDAVFTQWPQRATVYGCPIAACTWAHTMPYQDPCADGAATIEEASANAVRTHFTEAESVVRAHLETHSLLEWVTEITRLREQGAGMVTVRRDDLADVYGHAWYRDVDDDPAMKRIREALA